MFLAIDIIGELRKLVINIIIYIYKGLAGIYEVFGVLARVNIFSTDGNDKIVSDIYRRIQAILYVVMVFYLIFQFIKYIIQPDSSNDSEKGMGASVKKIVVVVLLLAFTPSLFNFSYTLKDKILDSRLIEKVILGGDGKAENLSDKEGYCSPIEHGGKCTNGGIFSARVFSLFVKVSDKNSCGEQMMDNGFSYNSRMAVLKRYIAGSYGVKLKFGYGFGDICKIEKDDVVVEQYFFDIEPLFAIAVGLFIIWIFINYCVETGRLVIQFAFLQLVAPIPILSYLAPNKDGMFNKWKKLCFSTYLDVFIRLAIISFVLLLVTIVLDLNILNLLSDLEVSPELETFVTMFLIVGLLMFALKAPDLLKQLLPQGLSSNANFGFGKKGAAVRPLASALGATLGASKLLAAGARGLGRGAKRAFPHLKNGFSKARNNARRAWRLNKYGVGYREQFAEARKQRKDRRVEEKDKKKQQKKDVKDAKKKRKEAFEKEMENEANAYKNRKELGNKEKSLSNSKKAYEEAAGEQKKLAEAHAKANRRMKELEGKPSSARTTEENEELSRLKGDGVGSVKQLSNELKESAKKSGDLLNKYRNDRAEMSQFASEKFGIDDKEKKVNDAKNELIEARRNEEKIRNDPSKTPEQKKQAIDNVKAMEKKVRSAVSERDGEAMRNYLSAQDEYNEIMKDPTKSAAEKIEAANKFNEARNNMGFAYSHRENQKTAVDTYNKVNSEISDIVSAADKANKEYNDAKIDFDTAESNHNTAKSNYDVAKTNLETAKLNYSAARREEETKRLELDRIKNDPTSSQDAINVAQSAYDNALSNLSGANDRFQNANRELSAAENDVNTSKINLEQKNNELMAKSNSRDSAAQRKNELDAAISSGNASKFSSLVNAKKDYDQVAASPDSPTKAAELAAAQSKVDAATKEYEKANIQRVKNVNQNRQADAFSKSILENVDTVLARDNKNFNSISELSSHIDSKVTEFKQERREQSTAHQVAKKVGKMGNVLNQVAGDLAGSVLGAAGSAISGAYQGFKIDDLSKVYDFSVKKLKSNADSLNKLDEYVAAGGKTTITHRVAHILSEAASGLGFSNPIHDLNVMNKRLEIPIEKNNASSTNLGRIITAMDDVENVVKSSREAGKLRNDISVDLNGYKLKNNRIIHIPEGTTAHDFALSTARAVNVAKSDSEVKTKAANEHKNNMSLSIQDSYSSIQQSLTSTDRTSRSYYDEMVNAINSNGSLSDSDKSLLLEQAQLDYSAYKSQKELQEAEEHQNLVEKAIDEATMTRAVRIIALGGGIKELDDAGIKNDKVYNQINSMISSVSAACTDKGTADSVANTLIEQFGKTSSDFEFRLVSKNGTINKRDFATATWTQLSDLAKAVRQSKNNYDTENETLKEQQRLNNQKIAAINRDKEALGGTTGSSGGNK